MTAVCTTPAVFSASSSSWSATESSPLKSLSFLVNRAEMLTPTQGLLSGQWCRIEQGGGLVDGWWWGVGQAPQQDLLQAPHPDDDAGHTEGVGVFVGVDLGEALVLDDP